jgi:3',5'-cyclic AMP phosphodiesterase CpdA
MPQTPPEYASDILASYKNNKAIAALPRLRVVHLSDLHFVTHSTLRRLSPVAGLRGHDKDTLQALQTKVEMLKPHLLFATGDHTTWGDKTSLAAAKDFLANLAWRAGLADDSVHWIPGNHDILLHYYFRIPFAKRAYEKIFGQTAALKVVSACGYKIAIYSFDSTIDRSNQWSPLWPLVGSRGSVSRSSFNNFNSAIQAPEAKEECFKIAQIHHHPLPIPYKPGEGFGPELTTMTNGGTFIAYMQQSGVNLILHGHEHHPYSCRYCYDPNNPELVVAAAGTACQAGAPLNSFNYLEIVPNNRIVIFEYRYAETGFHRDPSTVKIFDLADM